MNTISNITFNMQGSRPISVSELTEIPKDKNGVILRGRKSVAVLLTESLTTESILALKCSCKVFQNALDTLEIRSRIGNYKFGAIPLFKESLQKKFQDPFFLAKLSKYCPLERNSLIRQALGIIDEQFKGQNFIKAAKLCEVAQILLSSDIDKNLEILRRVSRYAKDALPSFQKDQILAKISNIALSMDIYFAFKLAEEILDSKSKVQAFIPILEFLFRTHSFNEDETSLEASKNLIHSISNEISEKLMSIEDARLTLRFYNIIVCYTNISYKNGNRFIDSLVSFIKLTENSPEKNMILQNLAYKIIFTDFDKVLPILSLIANPNERACVCYRLAEAIQQTHPQESNVLRYEAFHLIGDSFSHLEHMLVGTANPIYSKMEIDPIFNEKKAKNIFASLEEMKYSKEFDQSILDQFFNMPLSTLIQEYETYQDSMNE